MPRRKRDFGQAEGYATDRCHRCGDPEHNPLACTKRRLPQDVFGISKSFSQMLEPKAIKEQGFDKMEDLLIFDLEFPRKDQQIRWPNPPKPIKDYTEEERWTVLISVCRFVRPEVPPLDGSSSAAESMPSVTNNPETSLPDRSSATRSDAPMQTGPEASEPSLPPCPHCNQSFTDMESRDKHTGPCYLVHLNFGQ